MTIIYDATNDRRPMVDVLEEVPTGGVIFGGARFYRKTGPGRCKALDVRHFDHEADGRDLAEFGAQAADHAEWRQVYKNALETLPAPKSDPFAFRRYVDDSLEAERDLDATHAAASNRWGY